ncbi:hypothetical protein ACO0K0_19785 [Undibacterium sp. SXout11W]|uniref:hypothetical protein n=1 Tax=Undibacterium sp. SXout11W TaxID=3413050 RepID=UPI003BF36E89
MKIKGNKTLLLLIFVIAVGGVSAASLKLNTLYPMALNAVEAAKVALVHIEEMMAMFFFAQNYGKVSQEDVDNKAVAPIVEIAKRQENAKLDGETQEEYQLRVTTLYKGMENNARSFAESETEKKGKVTRPEVYTWADIEPRRSTVPDVNPGAELDGQGNSLAMFLKIATHPRNLLIYSSYYVNVKLPQFEDNGVKKTEGAINVQKWKDPSANGGFFWSGSSNLIYVGENHCLELDGGGASNYVKLNWCTLDSPKQMWRRIVDKTHQTNGGPVAVAYESLAYPGKCMGSTAPLSTLTSLYVYDCKSSSGALYSNVIFSYESDWYLPPLETTAFKYGRKAGEFEAQHTSFSCIQKLVAAAQNSKTDNSQVCDNSSSKSLSRDARSTNDVQDVNRISDEFTLKVYPATGGSNSFTLDRHHYMGTKAIAPLLPGQWRSYIINIGQGSFTVLDGYAWPHPVIIDMGSATKVSTTGSVKAHAVALLKFMNWMMQTGKSIRIKKDLSEASTNNYVRSPIVVISHADRDHYNLLEFMFNSCTDEDSSLMKLPQPYAVYIGGTIGEFTSKSQSETTPLAKTRKWLKQLSLAKSGTQFYQNLTFSSANSMHQKLMATDNSGTQVQINAAIPLILPDLASNTEAIDVANRTDRPWLYFLESNPTAKGHNATNRQSLIVSVADGFYSITAPADATKENEANASSKALKFGIQDLRGLVLASHHGADTFGSNSKQFYKEMAPSSVIFSAGNSNTYGHPTFTAYEAIKDYNEKLLCLSANGIGNKHYKQCNIDPAHEGYIGEQRTTFPKGGKAVFLTDNTIYFDPESKEDLSFRQDIAIGGDIVVTVTPIGGMLSKYYPKGKLADMKLGAIATSPTIEYYFSNYKTGTPGDNNSPLRGDPTRLFNSHAGQIRESQYCSDLYFDSPIGTDSSTLNAFHMSTGNKGPSFSDKYTLVGSAGRMFNYKFSKVSSDVKSRVVPVKDGAITQIPMFCTVSPG